MLLSNSVPSFILRFPAELLVVVLQELDLRTLLICRRVCINLCALIDGTTCLQYKIALCEAGMEDGSGTTPIYKRLNALEEHVEAWHAINSTQISHDRTPFHVWDSSQGIFGHLQLDRSAFSFVRFPSARRGIQLEEWDVPVSSCVDNFFLDPSQDLLVALEEPSSEPWALYTLRILTLTDGTLHPAARSHTIQYTIDSSAADVPLSDREISARICGCHIAIVFYVFGSEAVNHVRIYNWKTGSLMLNIGDPLESFWFLTENLYGMVTLEPPEDGSYIMSRYLKILLVDQEPSSFGLVCTFELPKPILPFNHYFEVVASPCHEGTSHTSGYFHSSPQNRLLAISFVMMNNDNSGVPIKQTLFVLFSTILDCLKIQPMWYWSDWALKTRVLNLDYPLSGVAGIYGVKAVVSHPTNQISIYDFNQLDILRDIYPRSSCYIMQPTPLPSVFQDGGHTALPCRVMTRDAPAGYQEEEVTLWEDGLAFLPEDEESDNSVGTRFEVVFI